MQQAIAAKAMQQTMAIAQMAEQQLDQAIDHFDNLSKDDIDKLRSKRKQQLQEKQKMMEEWRRLGHGQYQEIGDEKQWFEEAKANRHLVTHFYRGTTEYCKLVDLHLQKIAPKHMETRFIKIDAEKCAYLVERLHITIMPTIIMTEDNYAVDRIEGFFELGNTDKFSTEDLEERLSKKGVIDYDGPPPPNAAAAGMGGVDTNNRNNKDGKAVYESARARFMAEMDEEDPFASDHEGAAEAGAGSSSSSGSSESAAAGAGSKGSGRPTVPSAGAVSGATTNYEDASVKFY